MQILRRREVTARTGLSRTTLWRLERSGRFPQRIRLSRNAVGWYAQEVTRWLADRPRGIAFAGDPESHDKSAVRPEGEAIHDN